MRIGEKCIFTVDMGINYGNIKLKTGHRYTGYWGGEKTVVYKGFRLTATTIEPIKKTVVKKEKAPTASDYKNFADLCFEVGVRYRDDWTSVISGQKFEEGDWNGLQAGHGVSRQHWATRHNPLNCHAITSGENFHMSIGTTTIIAKYWAYVAKKYGQGVVDDLINETRPTPKLSISYLKEDCIKQYYFLYSMVTGYLLRKKTKLVEADPDYYIKWRCEKFPKAKIDGIMKVLKIVKGEM